VSEPNPAQPELAALLAEQRAYYRARAAEYDEWFFRKGRYDHGAALNALWAAEAQEVREALKRMGPVEQALELACGTGLWTRDLIEIARRVVALDSSAEMIALNRSRLGNHRVSYQLVDLFNWHPHEQVDLVFMGFWLSHVPPELLPRFLSAVRDSVPRGGRLFLVDSLAENSATASDNPIEPSNDGLQMRKLNDGREFRIVKTFYDPARLAEALRSAGFDAQVKTTAHYFIYATAKAV
jgi:demethylmenaquinone methyltransferase/2-methoxy-6-polyprenyl-1,4-benzoquinol methylase